MALVVELAGVTLWPLGLQWSTSWFCPKLLLPYLRDHLQKPRLRDKDGHLLVWNGEDGQRHPESKWRESLVSCGSARDS